MINPVNAMKVLNERKAFIQNHPEFFHYIIGTFGQEIEEGTLIEIKVSKPDGRVSGADARICAEDRKLMQALQNLIN